MTTTEPTVEEALKELREMWPHCSVRVQHQLNQPFHGEASHSYAVAVISSLQYEFREQWSSDTLGDCMAQVRAWKEQEK